MNEKVSHYRILEKLGGGGMDVVYKVAPCFSPARAGLEAGATALFQRDARAAANTPTNG